MDVESKKRLGQRRVVREGRKRVVGVRAAHSRECLPGSLVPLISGQRLQTHPRSPLGFPSTTSPSGRIIFSFTTNRVARFARLVNADGRVGPCVPIDTRPVAKTPGQGWPDRPTPALT